MLMVKNFPSNFFCMLYIVGLGLNDEQDVTLKGLDVMRKCDTVFCEFFTNKWHGDLDKLAGMIEKKIFILERQQVESDFLIKEATHKNVTLLVPGDPLAATTHMQLILDAKRQNVNVQIVHSSSVYTAVAVCGLHLYKFGRTTTLVFSEKRFRPTSHYDVILNNSRIGLHSLVLMDIQEKREMSVKEGLEILLEVEKEKKKDVINENTKIVAMCRLGGEQIIKYDTIDNLIKFDIKETPAVIVIPGDLNFKEEEALKLWE